MPTLICGVPSLSRFGCRMIFAPYFPGTGWSSWWFRKMTDVFHWYWTNEHASDQGDVGDLDQDDDIDDLPPSSSLPGFWSYLDTGCTWDDVIPTKPARYYVNHQLSGCNHQHHHQIKIMSKYCFTWTPGLRLGKGEWDGEEVYVSEFDIFKKISIDESGWYCHWWYCQGCLKVFHSALPAVAVGIWRGSSGSRVQGADQGRDPTKMVNGKFLFPIFRPRAIKNRLKIKQNVRLKAMQDQIKIDQRSH